MSTIFKFGYNVNNKVTQIYIFIGERIVNLKTDVNLNKLFQSEPNNDIFKDIFSPKELLEIKKESIELIFVNEQIHLDDTIETIKKKLIVAMKTKYLSFGEIYIYAKHKRELNSVLVYQLLTQNGKLELTKERLVQFILNIDNVNIEDISDKEIYDYDDIINLNLDKSPVLVSEPIGQKFIAVETTYPYTVNPFNAIIYDKLLERFVEELTTTTNQSLLMDTGKIEDNMIFICSAQEALIYAEQNNLSEESTIKIYFPYLFEKEIIDLSQLKSEKENLLIETLKMTEEEAWLDNINNINLFNDIYNYRNTELKYIEAGIKEIDLTINAEYSFNLPLDVVFKLIHVTETVPFVKYNPTKRQEKIYRLYTDKMATNGKKIPYLTKATIFKLIRQIGGNKGVSVYIEHKLNNDTIVPIICEFLDNGNIIIKSKFTEVISISQLDELIKNAANPVIDIIKNYLMQSGYKMNNFNSINSPDININKLEYVTKIPIKKKMNLTKILKCVSSIFSVISDNIDEGAVMRFKRVSNYDAMSSEEAYIIEMINSGARDVEIIQGLMDNYNVKPRSKAQEKLANFVSSLETAQSVFKSKKLKIKNNPGFLTTMTKENFTSNLTITVSGINDISYITTIPLYIDSIIRITQDPETTDISSKIINARCKGKEITKEITKIKDIIAPAENIREGKGNIDIIANEIVFNEPDEELEKQQQNMLDLLLDYSDDDDDDDDDTGDTEDEDEDDTQKGGGDDIDVNITGMNLSNPNPFFNKLQKLEPSLFLQENEGGFSAYSRICPWNVRRQPVILTKEEKERIDKDHKGSYDKALEYKSSKDGEEYYYICPRYWSLKDGVSLTEEQAKSGKYGKIIPKNAKKVPEGANVFEFTSKNHISDETQKYMNMYPGFLKSDKHPDGSCIPCCFKSWDSPEQQKRRDTCKENVGTKKTTDKNKQSFPDEYIKASDKFPLEPNRYGYLPFILQRFLNTDNHKCQISNKNTNLKLNHPCLLRHGVEVSKSQSFVACIADIWVDTKDKSIPTIAEMKKILIDAMDIDKFMTLQNGTLVDTFNNDKEVSISEFKKSKLYKNTNLKNESELSVLKKIASAYTNFIDFLNDPTITIDYRYLWDLICMPNNKLFTRGINLVIIEIKDDDITSNVEIICPTNHYSSSFFDANKKTVIIMKKGNYYEPLYAFEDTGDKFLVTRQFNLKNKTILPDLYKSLELIKMSMNTGCGAMPSLPNVYKFKQNIPLDKLVDLLNLKNFNIETQIINYNNKVIAVVASKEGVKGIIPCYPSSLIIDLTDKYTWMDDNLGNPYKETRDFLLYVYELFKGRIPCKPSIKIIEDGLIVGILTQTNQFVPISEPIVDIFGDDMPAVSNSNYAVIDKISLTNKNVDRERIEYIKKIKLETNFFNVFRNTVRILLGEFKHSKIREEIEKIMNSPTILYLNKLQQIDNLLRELTKNEVIFSSYSKKILNELTEISSCYTSDESCKSKRFCLTKDDGKCALVIPKNNLISNRNNEQMYYGQMADEIIRYNRIRSFIFKPNTFLSFSELKYNLRDDEIILLHSLLTQGYFDDLIVSPTNKYVKHNTYDNVEPLKTQTYTNVIDINKYLREDVNVDADENDTGSVKITHLDTSKSNCIDKVMPVIRKWHKEFPTNTMELVFKSDPPSCSFEIILLLINQHTNKSLTIAELKEILFEEYISVYKDYSGKILEILRSQGKIHMVKNVKKNIISFDTMIMNDNYYATNLDIWVLAVKFNIPLIFYSSTELRENFERILVANSNDTDKYYFIKSPGVRNNDAPSYRLIIIPTNISLIPLNSLNLEFQKEIRAMINKTRLLKYISNFKNLTRMDKLNND